MYLQLTIGKTYSLNTKGSTFDAHTAAKHLKQEGEHFLEFKLNIGFTVPFKYLSDIRPHLFLASKWSETYRVSQKRGGFVFRARFEVFRGFESKKFRRLTPIKI